MGLLDGIAGQALGSILGGGQQSNLISAVAGLLGGQQSGGLSGLVSQFAAKGLGDVVNSWVGTGQNLPITPQQIQHGLGSDVVSQLAQKVGVSPDMVSQLLAQHLPNAVDKLTPQGQVPQGDLAGEAMKVLGGLFK
jgi:uncharacterized protein YidB (DUF937 family)